MLVLDFFAQEPQNVVLKSRLTHIGDVVSGVGKGGGVWVLTKEWGSKGRRKRGSS